MIALRPSSKDDFFDGVIVQTGAMFPTTGDISEIRSFMSQREKTDEAATALVSELNKTGIQARTFAGNTNFPPNVLVISVGLKPNPHAERMGREAMENMQRQMLKENK